MVPLLVVYAALASTYLPSAPSLDESLGPCTTPYNSFKVSVSFSRSAEENCCRLLSRVCQREMGTRVSIKLAGYRLEITPMGMRSPPSPSPAPFILPLLLSFSSRQPQGHCIPPNSCTGGQTSGLCPGSSKCCVAETRSAATYTHVAITKIAFEKLFGGVKGARK